MNCTDARHDIDRLPTGRHPEGETGAHLGQCELCRQYYGDVMLMRTLATLEAPEPEADFIERALERATAPAQAPAPRRWPLQTALAASVLAAVAAVLLSWNLTPVEQSSEVVEWERPLVEPLRVSREEVRIVIHSQHAHPNAEIAIELDGQVELEGYTGHRRLVWNTPLKPGANLLVLPVLMHNDGGEVRVRSHFGEATHEVNVQVTRQAPDGHPATPAVLRQDVRKQVIA